MSQLRTRKAPTVNETAPRGPALLSKASGDTVIPHPKSNNLRSKSKNSSKVPKELRYDLENALVGLCDVWFENIKPQLVRNNIKLHVHAGSAGVGAGDIQHDLPPGAPGCSHLDTASTASDCELCRLLFNAAKSIESAVSQAALPTSVTTVFTSETTTNATAGAFPRS